MVEGCGGFIILALISCIMQAPMDAMTKNQPEKSLTALLSVIPLPDLHQIIRHIAIIQDAVAQIRNSGLVHLPLLQDCAFDRILLLGHVHPPFTVPQKPNFMSPESIIEREDNIRNQPNQST